MEKETYWLFVKRCIVVAIIIGLFATAAFYFVKWVASVAEFLLN